MTVVYNFSMHELAVTESLLTLTLKHANQAGATRVRSINLVIGQLSSIMDESVQFYWDFVAKGTIAEGAELFFERVPALLSCKDCGCEYAPDGRDLVCPTCSGVNIQIIKGEEFNLDSIDIDT